jgi:uncharacterized membrane protein YdjX (TVP38/TMEM64 family)
MRRWLPALALVIGLVAVLFSGGADYLSFEALAAHRAQLLGWVEREPIAAVATFIAVYAVATAVSLPGGAVLSVTGGFLFGIVLGTAAIVVGATVGAVVVFLAAQTALGSALKDRAKGTAASVLAELQRHPLQYLLVLRLVPAMPFWLVNLLPAVVGMRLGTFVLGTAVGIVPGSAVLASIGVGLDSVLAEGRTPDLGVFLTAPVLLPLLALAALSIAPILWQRWKRS